MLRTLETEALIESLEKELRCLRQRSQILAAATINLIADDSLHLPLNHVNNDQPSVNLIKAIRQKQDETNKTIDTLQKQLQHLYQK